MAETLAAVTSDERYSEAARGFAAEYAGFDPKARVEGMAGRVEELLGRNRPGREAGAAPGVKAAWVGPTETRRPASVFRA